MSAGWGEAPWQRPARLPASSPPESCDVAIVGGGFAGLATALALAQRGIDVALFEADRIAAGASGRTGGIVLEDTAAGQLPGSGDCIPELERVIASASIDCDLELPGCFELVHDERAPLWQDGEGLLSIAQTLPGGTLDPCRLASGLADAAVRAGATLCEGARVTAVERDGVRIGAERVRAGTTVLALNAYLRKLLRIEDEFACALTLGLVSEPLGCEAIEAIGLGAGHAFYTADLPYLWGRPLDDRLLAGGGLALDPDGRLERIDVGSPELAARFDSLAERLRGLHPALAGARFEMRWGGPVAFRRARLPILCRPRSELIVTGAYAGHGVALSLRCAEWIAAAIADNVALPEWGSTRLP